jgi:hypothetical protein
MEQTKINIGAEIKLSPIANKHENRLGTVKTDRKTENEESFSGKKSIFCV